MANIDSRKVLLACYEIYRRSMQKKPVLDTRTKLQKRDPDTGLGIWEFNANTALKAMELIGKNVLVKAFDTGMANNLGLKEADDKTKIDFSQFTEEELRAYIALYEKGTKGKVDAFEHDLECPVGNGRNKTMSFGEVIDESEFGEVEFSEEEAEDEV